MTIEIKKIVIIPTYVFVGVKPFEEEKLLFRLELLFLRYPVHFVDARVD